MRKRKAQGQAELPLDDTFRSTGLFADHFLEHLLPELRGWEREGSLTLDPSPGGLVITHKFWGEE